LENALEQLKAELEVEMEVRKVAQRLSSLLQKQVHILSADNAALEKEVETLKAEVRQLKGKEDADQNKEQTAPVKRYVFFFPFLCYFMCPLISELLLLLYCIGNQIF